MAYDVKWIKVTTDVFDDHKIKIIDSLPERDTILVIWFKLLTLAGQVNDDGRVYLMDGVPYTDETLASVFNRPLNSVRLTLETLSRMKMIEMGASGIQIVNWMKHQNNDGLDRIRQQNRERQRRFAEKRKSQKILPEGNISQPQIQTPKATKVTPPNVSVTLTNAVELELDREKEEEKNKGTASPSTAVAVVAKKTAVAKRGKESDLPPEQLAVYHALEEWFKKVPAAEAVMYKDRAAAARTGKALKTITERCFNLAKGGDPEVVARAMMEAFYNAVKTKGAAGLRTTFSPVSLATEWVWDAVFQMAYTNAEIATDNVEDRIAEIRRRRAEREAVDAR